MTCTLRKERVTLQEPFVYLWIYKSVGKTFPVFLGKYPLKVVKLKGCKIELGGSKTFKKRHYRICKCRNIANLVNTTVARIIKCQPDCGSNHLLSVNCIKVEKERGSLAC